MNLVNTSISWLLFYDQKIPVKTGYTIKLIKEYSKVSQTIQFLFRKSKCPTSYNFYSVPSIVSQPSSTRSHKFKKTSIRLLFYNLRNTRDQSPPPILGFLARPDFVFLSLPSFFGRSDVAKSPYKPKGYNFLRCAAF